LDNNSVDSIAHLVELLSTLDNDKVDILHKKTITASKKYSPDLFVSNFEKFVEEIYCK
jgi:hypothetical protein